MQCLVTDAEGQKLTLLSGFHSDKCAPGRGEAIMEKLLCELGVVTGDLFNHNHSVDFPRITTDQPAILRKEDEGLDKICLRH